MELKELKSLVIKWERNLKAAKTGGQADEIAHAESKLSKLKKELEEAEFKEGKEAATKDIKKNEPVKETKAEIAEDKDVQEVHKRFSLIHSKSDKNLWYVKNNKTGKEDLEIEKRSDGKFHVVCLTKDKMKFDTLEQAVNHITKTRYASEVKELVKIKRDRKKAQEKFKEKHPSGETTPVNDFRTAKKKIKEKLEEAIDDGESIEKQIESLKNLIKQLTELLNKLEKESKNQ